MRIRAKRTTAIMQSMRKAQATNNTINERGTRSAQTLRANGLTVVAGAAVAVTGFTGGKVKTGGSVAVTGTTVAVTGTTVTGATPV